MMHIFYAEYRYGRAHLTKYEVIKETPKLYKLGNTTKILGFSHWARQLRKDDPQVFDDPIDAVKYMITRVAKRHSDLLNSLEDNVEQGIMLHKLLEELINEENEMVAEPTTQEDI
jgi:hypothetical protein